MLRDQLKLLIAYWIRPWKAPSQTLDRGRLGIAFLFALAIAIALQVPAEVRRARALNSLEEYAATHQRGTPPTAAEQERMKKLVREFEPGGALDGRAARSWIGGPASNAFKSLFLWSAVFVPLSLALVTLFESRGRTGLTVQQNFAGLLCCVLFGWGAAFLPLCFLHAVIPWFSMAALAYFLVLATLAVRTVMGSETGSAVGAVLVSTAVAGGAGYLTQFLGGFGYLLMSPWLLYYLWGSAGPELTLLAGGLGKQQGFRRHLEALTLNERDADAHYQLGLIYADRRDWEQAEQRFRRAAEIDPQDADYLFHLGRTLRERNNPEGSVEALERAAKLNPKVSSNEVWRELGAAYLALRMFDPAAAALRKYTEYREYDPQGLVLLGQALRGLGQDAEAIRILESAIGAAETMPAHRRGEARRWASAARQELRSR